MPDHAASGAAVAAALHPRRENDRWRAWRRDAVVYEVYLRSFLDSDDDGEGDLNGLYSRLDNLVELGVDAMWTVPWFPSPMPTADTTSRTTATSSPGTAVSTGRTAGLPTFSLGLARTAAVSVLVSFGPGRARS
ncbi:alpha-amylase family glycosyl hydrolase [Terrabacter sp. MAHUQ-38]|uniref:alpha-amylase family glycosyl hydrolase n=1 Tax=unclassified Terrabacter TaxID=2630222 RepID=UPI00351C5809